MYLIYCLLCVDKYLSIERTTPNLDRLCMFERVDIENLCGVCAAFQSKFIHFKNSTIQKQSAACVCFTAFCDCHVI